MTPVRWNSRGTVPRLGAAGLSASGHATRECRSRSVCRRCLDSDVDNVEPTTPTTYDHQQPKSSRCQHHRLLSAVRQVCPCQQYCLAGVVRRVRPVLCAALACHHDVLISVWSDAGLELVTSSPTVRSMWWTLSSTSASRPLTVACPAAGQQPAAAHVAVDCAAW